MGKGREPKKKEDGEIGSQTKWKNEEDGDPKKTGNWRRQGPLKKGTWARRERWGAKQK